MPGVVLFASFLGFGSLARGAGIGLGEAVVTTAAVWALPGQVVMVEMASVGASLFGLALAVALTNARLMPMVVTLAPLLEAPGRPRWQVLALAHLIAVTTWANGLQTLPTLRPEQRVPWFATFAAILFGNTVVATMAGYYLAGVVSPAITLGLVFLNPLYFMLLFVTDLRQRARMLSLCFGAVLGPALHRLMPDYGLMVSGMLGGSLAFFADEILRRRGVGA